MSSAAPYYDDDVTDHPFEDPPSQNPFGFSFHVYGGKGAFTIRETSSASKDDPIPTINIEGAKAKGVRSYDWSKKITLQVTKQEIAEVACVLFGFLEDAKFDSHGEAKNKGFEVKNQNGGYFMSVFEGGKGAVAVPIGHSEGLRFRCLVLRQLTRYLRLSSERSTLMLLDQTANHIKQEREAKANRGR